MKVIDAYAAGLVCVLLAACAGVSPPPQPGGSGGSPLTTEHSVTTPDGRTRTYRLVVPSSHARPAPLLVALHGGLGSGAQFARSSGFDALASANSFIVAYPDGVGRAPDGSGGVRTWNGGRCCGAAAAHNVDDVAFIRLLVADVESKYPVDAHRVYASGHSNGGIMALRLACEAADLFAGVGVQSATLEIEGCVPRKPVSVLQIHGSADTNIPIDGGWGSGLAGIAFSPPRQAASTVAAAQGCTRAPTVTVPTDHPHQRLSQWKGCAGNAAVTFIEVAGADHAWMGKSPHQDIDASAAIWSFLAAHPR